MKKILTVIALLLVFNQGQAKNLEIVGTGDGMQILRMLALEFEKRHPDMMISVPDSIGSSGGIHKAGTRQARLARVARPLKPKEQHYGLEFEPWGRVPVVFYSHPDVGVDNLTDQQVLDIFSGQIANWKELGGKDEKIRVIMREETDSSYRVLKKKFPGFAQLRLTPRHMVITTTQKTLAAVADYDGAISFGPLPDVVSEGLHVFSLDDRKASDSDWPYFSLLGFVYHADERKGLVARFLDFMRTEDAHKLIRENSITPVNP